MTQAAKRNTQKTTLYPLFWRKYDRFLHKKELNSTKKAPAVTIHRGNFCQKKYVSKERDSETGLYYYGARYLDPKASMWLSGDPAVAEYIPSAPVNDEAKKRNGSLPGMGGVFNYVNLHVYHYAGNNPVKYVDPDGRTEIDTQAIRAYLEQHPIGREAIAAINNGEIKLRAINYYMYKRKYIDNGQEDGPFILNGFFRSSDDTIVVSTLGFTSENIASTIVHEYIHFTQKGKNMAEAEMEYEAHLIQAEFNLLLGFSQKDASFTKNNNIDQDAVRSYVDRIYSFSEGNQREFIWTKITTTDEWDVDL